MKRRLFLNFFVGSLFALCLGGVLSAAAQTASGPAPSASGENYVEFLIGDRTEKTRMWGHVSLRVVGGGVDQIFDFGRYGKMWGRKDSAEGEPILRVWKPGQFTNYRNYHLKDGGTTLRYRFASNAERNSRILGYFGRMTNGARKTYDNAQMTAYNSNYKNFHAVEVNCVTVAIDAFMAGFPEYDVNNAAYAKARTLQWFMQGEAQQYMYDVDNRRWNRIWWPLDLMALLDERFVKKGLAGLSRL